MSTLNVSNITDGTDTVGTSYVLNGAAKGWCSMTGGTGTVSLQPNSLNASSAVDVAQGKYSFNWTSAMSDAHYPATGACVDQAYTYSFASGLGEARTTSKVGTYWIHHGGNAYDVPDLEMVIHGDLA